MAVPFSGKISGGTGQGVDISQYYPGITGLIDDFICIARHLWVIPLPGSNMGQNCIGRDATRQRSLPSVTIFIIIGPRLLGIVCSITVWQDVQHCCQLFFYPCQYLRSAILSFIFKLTVM
ncbi:hypothetical protein D3C85_1521760 [compost metagenome]